MKNDYLDKDTRISIPPTLLFTVIGVIPNVTRVQTSDFKKPGDCIFILGKTWKELGASEACKLMGIKGGEIPRVDAQSAYKRYRSLHALMEQKVISACHDCSDGGVAVTLAEMAIGGRLGCRVDMAKLPQSENMSIFELLYSESASRHIVTCRPEFAPLLEALGLWQTCTQIGVVTKEPYLNIVIQEKQVINSPIQKLAEAFKNVSKSSSPFQVS